MITSKLVKELLQMLQQMEEARNQIDDAAWDDTSGVPIEAWYNVDEDPIGNLLAILSLDDVLYLEGIYQAGSDLDCDYSANPLIFYLDRIEAEHYDNFQRKDKEDYVEFIVERVNDNLNVYDRFKEGIKYYNIYP
ncbi:MAG: hypothetical protein RBR69_00425 [Candidatus Cloacimonadaceae bacterium]|jgi:hypothetical protein|nr:hypothetical protein [Candidatus Cloacimonadaceae bacterium]